MPQENKKILSIVIPVFNEISFLSKLFAEINLYFNKENIALKCTKKAKYCKNKMFMVCEKHKNQCFGN